MKSEGLSRRCLALDFARLSSDIFTNPFAMYPLLRVPSTQRSRKYSMHFVRSMSGAAATLSGDLLKRDSVAASATVLCFRPLVSRPCLVISTKVLPRDDDNCSPVRTLLRFFRSQKRLGNVGRCLPSRRHAYNIPHTPTVR